MLLFENNVRCEETTAEFRISYDTNFDFEYIFSLLKYPLPLSTPEEAVILEGFGDKVCADMSKMLSQHAKELSLSQKEIIGMVCHINAHVRF